jgi:hypothetical protein
MYTPTQAIEAMQARINGVWDNEQLLRLGALLEDENEDLRRILDGVTEEIITYPAEQSATHVTSITVIDPDTQSPVSLSVYKEAAGGMFAIDDSYLEDEDNPIYSIFGNGLIELDE